MFSEQQSEGFMSIETSLLSFVRRVNDAYVASLTIRDLISDHDYQKLTIKNGKGTGIPLGNQHILPGYWFTVFVAPHESFKRVQEFIPSSESEKSGIDFESNNSPGHLPSIIETLKLEMDDLLRKIGMLDETKKSTCQRYDTVKRFTSAIANGDYKFFDEDNLKCTFMENDILLGFRSESTVKVSEFNELAFDFSKQLVKLLWPVVKGNEVVRSEVAKLFIGELFLQEL